MKKPSSRQQPSAAKSRSRTGHGKGHETGPGGAPERSGNGRRPGRRFGRPGIAARFREAFDPLWQSLFLSPVHLDAALSRAPAGVKSRLALVSHLLLRRPQSIARFLRFRLDPREPWELGPEALALWPTARAMASRLDSAFQHDAEFSREGRAHESDYPPAMVEEWKRDFGGACATELVQTLGEAPPLALRASRLQGSRDELLSRLNDSGTLPIRGRISKVAPLGFFFPEYAPVLSHDDFAKGNYEIQDEGSQLMALFALWPEELLPMLRKVPGACRGWPQGKELPGPSGTWTVVDACAGAGGKTLAMADAMCGKGQFFAYDVSVRKLESLRRRAKRAGLTSIKTLALPEGGEAEAIRRFHGSADRVLVDAPCSGWGVLRRNPDLKWRQPAETLERLAALQERLLDLYAPLVKPGGVLCYGVCTFRKAETTAQVKAFLQRHPEMESIGGGYLGPGPSDGFFLHAFRRKEA